MMYIARCLKTGLEIRWLLGGVIITGDGIQPYQKKNLLPQALFHAMLLPEISFDAVYCLARRL